MERKRGFTLIELLVVIAVIAILAAILFPVFAQVRAKARTSACLSNLRQIGTAALLYAQDYDDFILPWYSFSAPSVASVDRAWTTRIQPYLKSGGGTAARGVFVCPSWSEAAFQKGVNTSGCIPGFAFSAREIYAHYSVTGPSPRMGTGTRADPFFHHAGTGPLPNSVRGRAVPDAGLIVVTHLAAVLRPTETVSSFDGATWLTPPGVYNSFGSCGMGERHQGGANYLMLDGHSKWIAGASLSGYVAQDAAGKYFLRYLTYDSTE